jgi:hypothetical protein
MYLYLREETLRTAAGTELAGGYVSGTSLQPASPSAFTTPTIGTQLVLLTQLQLQPQPQPQPQPQLHLPQACEGTPEGQLSLSGRTPSSVSALSKAQQGHDGALLLLSPHELAGGTPSSSVTHQPSTVGVSGEVALVAPALGTSQRLLNKSHAQAR